MRILIVDDDYTCRAQFKALLSKYGDCDAAPNGTIALDLFAVAHQEGAPYALVTMDIEMPGMDGHAAVRAIREFEHKNLDRANGDIDAKILMVSARRGSDVIASFKDGCEGYMHKPVDAKEVVEVLKKLDLL